MVIDSTDTRTLLARASAGDAIVFAQLVEPLSVRLLVYIRRTGGRVLGGDCDEEDLLQTVLARAWGLLPDFVPRGQGSFHAWLVEIARHAISDRVKYLRAKDRGRPRHLESACEDGRTPPQPIDPMTTVSARLSRREECRRVEAALAALSPKHRDVVERHLLTGRTLGQIAEELQISKNAVWERLHRGLAHLRVLLAALE